MEITMKDLERVLKEAEDEPCFIQAKIGIYLGKLFSGGEGANDDGREIKA